MYLSSGDREENISPEASNKKEVFSVSAIGLFGDSILIEEVLLVSIHVINLRITTPKVE